MNTAIADSYQELRERVMNARQAKQPLVIRGGGSKLFYGRNIAGEPLDVRACSGIISYEPSELVITARAGTPLRDIEAALSAQGQMLPFEPPYFGPDATLGGAVACGLAGPRRPHTGAVRDFILGVKCLTGTGGILTFGGQVMKNVAGYDVSRLMAGALGTLGILLEVSIKVLPVPENVKTFCIKTDFNNAMRNLHDWAARPLPFSASCYDGQSLRIRLSGKSSAVAAAQSTLDLDEDDTVQDYWQRLRDHRLAFFNDTGKSLWRISVPSSTGALELQGDWLMEWGGALRWFKSDEPGEKIRRHTGQAGGHATLFRGGDRNGTVFHPLAPGVLLLHQRLKQVFDPDRIFNRGRMYPEI